MQKRALSFVAHPDIKFTILLPHHPLPIPVLGLQLCTIKLRLKSKFLNNLILTFTDNRMLYVKFVVSVLWNSSYLEEFSIF
jgi:hypothetical protein